MYNKKRLSDGDNVFMSIGIFIGDQKFIIK